MKTDKHRIEDLERRVEKLEKSTVDEKRVATLERLARMVKQFWAAAVLAVEDGNGEPGGDPSPPITVTTFGETTLQGKPIYLIEANDTDQLEITNASGGVSAFSADGQYLAVKKFAAGTNDGTWFAVRVSDRAVFELCDVTSGSDLNLNLVWAPTGNEYFAVVSGVLQRRKIDGTVVASRALGDVSHYSAGVITPQYRLEVGSQRNNPAITIYHSGTDSNGLLPFNPTTLALGTPFWFKPAFDAGSAAGTAVAGAKKLTNLVTFGSGYAGKPDVDQEHQHWVPSDGSTAVEIENLQFPGLTQAADTDQSHPAYRLQADGKVFELVGRDGSNQVDGNLWSYPPQVNQANRVRQWTLEKDAIADMFGGIPVGQFGYAHSDVGVEYSAASMRQWNYLGSGDDREGIVKIRNVDGAVWPIYVGMIKRNPSDFNTSPRPSICCLGSHAACNTERVAGKTDVLLMDLATPAPPPATVSELEATILDPGDYQTHVAAYEAIAPTNAIYALYHGQYVVETFTNAWVATGNVDYLHEALDYTEAIIAAAVDQVSIDAASAGPDGSRPRSFNGAIDAGRPYKGWNGDPDAEYLRQVQFTTGVNLMCYEMLLGKRAATVLPADIARAKTAFLFLARDVMEKFLTTNAFLWAQLFRSVEAAASRYGAAGAAQGQWSDKHIFGIQNLAYIEVLYPEFGETVPAWVGTRDWRLWAKMLMQVGPAMGPYYGQPMLYGLEWHNNRVYLDRENEFVSESTTWGKTTPKGKYGWDPGHANRLPSFLQTMNRLPHGDQTIVDAAKLWITRLKENANAILFEVGDRVETATWMDGNNTLVDSTGNGSITQADHNGFLFPTWALFASLDAEFYRKLRNFREQQVEYVAGGRLNSYEHYSYSLQRNSTDDGLAPILSALTLAASVPADDVWGTL